MQKEYNSQADPEKWDTRYWAQVISIPCCRHISSKQISYQKLHSQVQLIHSWIYEMSSQSRSCEAELYFSMKQQRVRLAGGCTERLNQINCSPTALLSPCFICAKLLMLMTSFSSRKKKEKEEEINLLRPEGCAHQLLELMKNTLELWVRKSWLLISEG